VQDEVRERRRADQGAPDPGDRVEARRTCRRVTLAAWGRHVRAVSVRRHLTDRPYSGAMSEGQQPTTVLIADDHRLMREGTAALLRVDDRIDVVGVVESGSEAIAVAERRCPDVVLLDLEMPGIGGIEACAVIRERCPATEVLILTVSENEPDLWAAFRVGAAGYLLKDMPPADLVNAVLAAGNGDPQIAPRMATRLLREFVEQGRPTADPLSDLSDREREVLDLLADGLRNREIATRLTVTEATVKTHVRHVLEKLRVRNRAEAAAFAARHPR
jgi:two-component system NarL family response regulator